MKISERDIRRAFANVKRDINEIHDIHKFSAQAFNNKLKTFETELRKAIDAAQQKAQNCKIAEIDELRRRIEEQNSDIQHKCDSLGSEHKSIRQQLTQIEKQKLSIQEVYRQVQAEMEKKYGRLSELSSQLKKQYKQLEELKDTVAKHDEEKSSFASAESLRRMDDRLIELKAELVLRGQLEDVEERMDAIDSRMAKAVERLQKGFDRLEQGMADVYSMKKAFVTKEQFANQRKEIKLLVEGLKDIEKIKKRLGKEGFGKKTARALTNFFTEEK